MAENNFMGPTLYSANSSYLVNSMGGPCKNGENGKGQDEEECFFLHFDMLHESPLCMGMVHDPEEVGSTRVFEGGGRRGRGGAGEGGPQTQVLVESNLSLS